MMDRDGCDVPWAVSSLWSERPERKVGNDCTSVGVIGVDISVSQIPRGTRGRALYAIQLFICHLQTPMRRRKFSRGKMSHELIGSCAGQHKSFTKLYPNSGHCSRGESAERDGDRLLLDFRYPC
jgi:hypothetical protein